ncbi:hypothetical protein ACFOSD_08610 [Salinispirillum marinum]|uniref:LapB rubredoxin metal binding domain-containing protein n=2 Tax=Saccharospirillaceae TaxID=255527 RepID=A0ABV8BDH9_9GAMM
MPDFSWEQVLIVCALMFSAGLWVQSRYHWLSYFRRRPSLADLQAKAKPKPESTALKNKSTRLVAGRTIGDLHSQGDLSFQASMDMAEAHRRQGDIQSAIEIHQSLYGRPGLSWEALQQAQLELAKDFYTAGILGRAEDLFRSLIAQRGAYSTDAARYLLKIYQQQKDWAAAVDVFAADSNLAQTGLKLEQVHMLCEHAQHIADTDPKKARRLIADAAALNTDSRRPLISSIRMAVMSGEGRELNRLLQRYIEMHGDRMDLLRDLLYSVMVKKPDYLARILPVLQRNQANPDVRLVHGELLCRLGKMGEGVALLDSVNANGVTVAFQLEHLARQNGQAPLDRIARTLAPLKERHWLYRCSHCGYETSTHHWHCPQCDRWETLGVSQGQFANLLI